MGGFSAGAATNFRRSFFLTGPPTAPFLGTSGESFEMMPSKHGQQTGEELLNTLGRAVAAVLHISVCATQWRRR